jgi:hypothetical protein
LDQCHAHPITHSLGDVIAAGMLATAGLAGMNMAAAAAPPVAARLTASPMAARSTASPVATRSVRPPTLYVADFGSRAVTPINTATGPDMSQSRS